jgi:UDP-N-acetylmuramoyl-L-alanyl-D-glutamate--2,6-diaminopimelate ligase
MTSHALKLDKVVPIKLDCAIFTSFSPDHQEFHDSEDDYFISKTKIIDLLKPNGHLIFNADNNKVSTLSKQVDLSIGIGFNDNADICIKKTEESLFYTEYLFKTKENDFIGSTQLMGDFNLMNIAMAFASAVESGILPVQIIDSIKKCDNVPGRLERINGAPFCIVVDYAHTPDAFKKIFSTLSSYISGKLIIVFGCAGERSKDRRYGLGRLAAEQANMSILTEEDSRSESIHDIVQDIESVMKESGATEGDNYKIILDRKEAIKFALEYADKDDFVLILGKGHEKSIESGGEIIPWDDRKITKELIDVIYN